MRPPLDTAERRRRLVVRHRLAPADRIDDPTQIAASLVALHATDPTSVYLQVQARSHACSVADVDRALYDDRTLLRMMGMRRTLFVPPTVDAPVIQHGAMDRVAAEQHRRLVKDVTDARPDGAHGTHGTDDIDGGDRAAWVDELADATVAALVELGGRASTAQLLAAEPRLGSELVLSPGKRWEARITIASRMVVLLGCQGRIVRGRPGGSWASRRYPWVLPEVWLGTTPPTLAPDVARTELVRRWLAVFGPAPESDLRWWTGWPISRVRCALAGAGATETEVDGRPMLVLADDHEPTAPRPPSASLLPVLDPTVMGWSDRDWFLGEHRPRLFDRNGNAGPTIWWDGRVVGGWGQASGGEIRTELFDDLGADGRTAVDAETERLQTWLGDRRIVPTFRTPTELKLTA